MLNFCPVCYGVDDGGPTGSSSSLEYQAVAKNDGETQTLQKIFFQLFQRYLNEGGEEGQDDSSSSTFPLEQLSKVGMVTCDNCLNEMRSFCKLYDQLKRTELLLNWKIEKIKSAMARESTLIKLVVKSVDKLDVDELYKKGSIETLDSLEKSKKWLVDKCHRKLKASSPTVCIAKLRTGHGKPEKSRSGSGESSRKRKTSANESSEINTEAKKTCLTISDDDNKKDQEMIGIIDGIKLERDIIHNSPPLLSSTSTPPCIMEPLNIKTEHEEGELTAEAQDGNYSPISSCSSSPSPSCFADELQPEPQQNGNITKTPFCSCRKCQKEFGSFHSFKTHFKFVHGEEQKREHGVMRQPRRHRRRRRPHIYTISSIDPLEQLGQPQSLFNLATGLVQCNFCTREFPDQELFHEHYQKSHLKLRFNCVACSMEFTNKAKVQHHYRSEHVGCECECAECHERFPDKEVQRGRSRQACFSGGYNRPLEYVLRS